MNHLRQIVDLEMVRKAIAWYDKQPAQLKSVWILEYPKISSESTNQYLLRLYEKRNTLEYLIP